MDNTVGQYAIGELLDGRYFLIPAYQRGYRWTEKQVGDLLRDLLCFAIENRNESGNFYCLQPIIARRITREDKLRELSHLSANIPIDELLSKKVWEIVDGQQRLTTIYLLYKYMLAWKHWDAEKLKEEQDGKELYHIIYSTREKSAEFLESIDRWVESESEINTSNIDFHHMAVAYKNIGEWIKDEGKSICKMSLKDGRLDTVRDHIFKLINGKPGTYGGSVQVLWYEIAEDNIHSSIGEFQKINTGKIRLTDAELIKGLFLLDKNFENGSKFN